MLFLYRSVGVITLCFSLKLRLKKKHDNERQTDCFQPKLTHHVSTKKRFKTVPDLSRTKLVQLFVLVLGSKVLHCHQRSEKSLPPTYRIQTLPVLACWLKFVHTTSVSTPSIHHLEKQRMVIHSQLCNSVTRKKYRKISRSLIGLNYFISG